MYNSDGYVLIDMSGVDMTASTQHVSGLFNRITKDAVGCNKLAVVINAGDLTPMAAVINRTLNYYVVTTSLYIFKINTNDILIIEESGEVTVDVTIIPTLESGVKVADFAIGSTEGSIYAPAQQSEINDNVTASNTTWSSDKINTQLSAKANSADLATVATTGAYSDLSGTPTIPTKTSQLTNDSGFITSAQVPVIDDTAISSSSVWSSYKTSAELGTKADDSDIDILNNEIGADTYDTTISYTAGMYCIYNNTLYRCKDSTSGAWDSSKWEAKTITSLIENNSSDIDNLYYKVGDTITATIYKEMAGRLTNAGDKVLVFYPTYKYISSGVQSVSLVLPSGNAGYIYTSVGGYALKAGTYAGTITDGGIYFLIDLMAPQQTGGIGCTVEFSNRTITFS